MTYREQICAENDMVLERYCLSMERVEEICKDEGIKTPYAEYFKKVSGFLLQIKAVIDLVETGVLRKMSIEELKKLNEGLFADIRGAAYESSYGNPAFSESVFGPETGKMLSFLYTELRGLIAYSFEGRLFEVVIGLELFIEIYNLLQEEEVEKETQKAVKSAIYYYVSDYSDITLPKRTLELLNPECSFATDIIMKEDLNDLSYLYYFGEYVSENELQIAAYLNSMPEEEINSMAHTYTEGFRKGFEMARLDMSKKSVVNIRYPLGFERMLKAAILQFEKLGLRPTISRAAVSTIHKRQHLKIGYHGTSPNKQYDYDHRFDNSLYLDKAFNERKLGVLKVCYEELKELADQFAGPAVIEVFGETPFAPQSKEQAPTLSAKQQELDVAYQRDSSILQNEYVKGDETSFTIIAYPIPEIGERFEEIFHETVKVNTLDMALYERIQQNIINALDSGEFVTITGRGTNRTNLTIQLPELKNPEKETNFENCLADVNIPVGEVFTSPKLAGTQGLLHVTEVFLRDLKYVDLELTFEDGKISDYTCKNFAEEEANRKFIKESIMYQHDTLPIGEFAIGTNTTAYVMGKKFGISPLLPILIAEKTGPHFAVGDTCFKMGEDMVTYNSDGKQMMAKDNEVSILRKTEIDKAYYNCHTDITIPYDELGDIVVHKKNGDTVAIIEEGRFVLPGTEELNLPLEELA